MIHATKGGALALASNNRLIWLRLCGVLAIGGLIFASLLLPTWLEQLRTGHWLAEHYFGYLVAALILCLGWPQPLLVAGSLAVAAVILEALQSLTPNHSASAISVLGGVAGALTGALIATLIMAAWGRRAHRQLAFQSDAKNKRDDAGPTKALAGHSGRTNAAKGIVSGALSDHHVILFRLFGVLAMGSVIFASLMLPTDWERMRTGHWFLEHFLGYFVASSIILLGWPRPFLVAGFLAVAAVILEALQSLSPSHSANLDSVIGGATGALAAALIAKLIVARRSPKTEQRRRES
jgi:VanZ family protein